MPAADRALLVDVLPTSEQELGNAWAGRMFGLGSVLGFLIGYIDLVVIFPFFGRSQLEVLVVLASGILLMTHGLTAFSVKERILLKTEDSRNGSQSAFRDIWTNARTLPRTIKQICLIQFFSWIGWFPILFFSTVWIGEIYKRQEIAAGRPANDPTLEADATRAGNGAMFWSSVLSLTTSVILPLLVTTSKARQNGETYQSGVSLWVRLLAKCKFHLAFLWALSHLIFAISMMLTLAAHTVWSASILITATGFCWAVTQWAPFSLLGQVIHASPLAADYELANRIPSPTFDGRVRASIQLERMALTTDNLSNDDILHDQDEDDFEKVEHVDGLGSVVVRDQDDAEESVNGEVDGEDESNGISNKAGIILGIHNVFIVIPQFLVTGLSSILFAIFEPSNPGTPAPRSDFSFDNSTSLPHATRSFIHLFIRAEEPAVGVAGFDSIGFIFRIGGISAGIACILCWRLARELR